MDVLILATSTYGDPFAAEWQPDLRLTTSYLRSNGVDVAFRYEAVPNPRSMAATTAEPPLVYVEVTEENRAFVLPFLAELRTLWRSRIVAGGLAATLAARDIEPYCDVTISGERDEALLDLVRGRTPDPARPLLSDLDVLGTIALDGLEPLAAGGTAWLTTSRGCYAYCAFCGVPDFYRQLPGRFWRGRSAAMVVDELELLAGRFGVRAFVFQDDNFIGPARVGRARAQAIAREILRRGLDIRFSFCCRLNDVETETFTLLREAGLCGVGVSIESAAQESLDLYRKGLRAAALRPALERLEALGIPCEINMIFFDPLLTLDGVRRNLDILAVIRDSRWLRYSDAFPFNELVPFPWSRVGRVLEAAGMKGYRHPAVARLAKFAAELRSYSGVTFKKRLLFDSLEPLAGSRDTERMREIVTNLAPAVRHWLGLTVCHDVIARACERLDAAGASADLADLVREFIAAIEPLRALERSALITRSAECDPLPPERRE